MHKEASLRPRAAIITVGTEVASGDIVNSNAQWLASALTDAQYDVTLHITVPDDRNGITGALDFTRQGQHSLVLITGGLGPTSDDFTRQVLAEWLQRDLVFDGDSWARIESIFAERGIPLTENNRQQSFFPRNATILVNDAGTANAFSVEHDNQWLVCLPGPPHEIQTIWEKHLREKIEAAGAQEPIQLLRWNCLGLSESLIAEKVEDVIRETGLVVGYRPHIPYVEVKLWIPNRIRAQHEELIQRLTYELKPWLIYQNGDDPGRQFLKVLSRFSEPVIFDLGTQGQLGMRLGSLTPKDNEDDKDTLGYTLITEISRNVDSSSLEDLAASDENLLLSVGPMSLSGNWQVHAQLSGSVVSKELKSPFLPQGRTHGRAHAAMVEMTLIAWTEMMSGGLEHTAVN